MAKEYNNILVHCLVNIGDVVLSTSAVALLRQIYPQARITMMVRPSAAEIALNNPVIDDVIIFDYKAKSKSIRRELGYIREIRRRQFDLAISLDRKLRPALLTWLAGIPVRIGPDRVFDDKPSGVTRLFTHVVPTPADFLHTHQSEIFMSIIRGFTGATGNAKPVIGRIMPQHQQKAAGLLAALPAAKRQIALCVKGTYPLKNWPPDYFVQLVKTVSERYQAAFFIVGAPEDAEYAEQIADQIPGMANLCGKTGLLDLAALMKRADLFITIDTGAMHIAATTGVPIIGFFRCVSSHRWLPLTGQKAVLDNYLPGCPTTGAPEGCPQHYCVKDIPVVAAVQAVETLLGPGDRPAATGSVNQH